jgi:F-type H+-transporting ATPase subunit alpha
MNVADQVMIIFAATKGFLDKVERSKVQAWELQFLAYMQEQKPEVRNALISEKKLSPDLVKKLEASINEFGFQFKG